MSEQKKILGREDIINAQDAMLKKIDVPEWGGTICMRVMSGRERDVFEDAVMTAKMPDGTVKIQGLRTLLLSQVLVDENAELLFTRDDLEVLNKKNAKVLTTLFETARTMNGIGDDSAKEAEKNS